MVTATDNYVINTNVNNVQEVRQTLQVLQRILDDLKATSSGLGTMSTQDADNVNIDGGTIDGVTIGGASPGAITATNLTVNTGATFAGATIANLGTVTTANIDGGTIDGTTIATSNITVGAGKTLDVSAGTLTLANDQISGDKVSGGTIDSVTLVIPAIADFTNATHNHSNNAGGGTIAFSVLTGTPTTLAGYGITDAQGLDAELTAIAGLISAADKAPYFTGLGTAALMDVTSFARSILDDINEATFKATVNLKIGTDVQAYDAFLASISLLGTAADKFIYTTALNTAAEADITSFGRSLVDDANASVARFTIGAQRWHRFIGI